MLLRDLRAFEVAIYPLDLQTQIASILSAYDDLIENNTRRIKVLEQMAQALYREWFVRFRYPGHEGVRMVESAVGLAPAGWEVRPLSDIAEIHRDNINPGQFPDETFAHFSIPAYDEGYMPVWLGGDHQERQIPAITPLRVALETQSPDSTCLVCRARSR